MKKELSLAAVALTILALPLTAQGTSAGDAARCDELVQRAEGGQTACIDRCVRHGTGRLRRMHGPDMSDIAWVFTQIGRCADLCVARSNMVVAHTRAACGSTDPCTEAMMRADASHMGCRYRCTLREYWFLNFDRLACDGACETDYDERIAAALAQPECSASDDPVR